uniref:Uncharacterized protein n=1 Tax=Arundo donax TaxID=35708 RepID=A0A0A9F3F0_ARUDO
MGIAWTRSDSPSKNPRSGV